MLNLMIIGASKILPICNLQEDFIKEEEIIGFFKFVRFYSGKLSFRVLQLIYSLLSKRNNTPLINRFITLLFELVLKLDTFSSQNSEIIFDLIFQIVSQESSIALKGAILQRLLQSIAHCDSNLVVAGQVLIGQAMEATPDLAKYLLKEVSKKPQNGQTKRNPLSIEEESISFQAINLLKNHYSPIVRKLANLILQ